ncbi:sel1 repeat family protein [Mucilaginibacter sp. HC2]|uniref:tetratricopeptide repeat protein n=1 Tax=Mucilaginibacter inviolabilis TaxID=2714892 RepID=UPI001409EEC8|nr:tetratricopeptide repeat protein [Mucilaginibacter inviolabilis]NHA06098.1 sel1 repeat family protein [Mucilaginibacter inviolabilis]
MKGHKNYLLALEVNKKMYEKGLRTEEQVELYSQYFKYIKKAAYQGYVEALFDMGQQYEDVGFLGIPNPLFDPKKCVYWYTKACNKGHAIACNNLSNFYALGDGCQQDFDRALELLKRSAELGSELGKKNYKMKLRDLANTGKYLK